MQGSRLSRLRPRHVAVYRLSGADCLSLDPEHQNNNGMGQVNCKNSTSGLSRLRQSLHIENSYDCTASGKQRVLGAVKDVLGDGHSQHRSEHKSVPIDSVDAQDRGVRIVDQNFWHIV